MENLTDDTSIIDEFKIFQPEQYETKMRALGPDYRYHHVILNKETNTLGYLYNKKYMEDDSYYSPYLMYTIGKKMGIDVPKAELGIYLEKDVEKPTYRESFFESSLVYMTGPSEFSYELGSGNYTFASPEVILAIYQEQNPETIEMLGMPRKNSITVDEYVMSNLEFIKRRDSRHLTDKSIQIVKQELIDRLMFELRLGIQGNSSLIMFKDGSIALDSYYLSSNNMFDLSVRPDWIKNMLEKDDNEFSKMLNAEHPPKYGLKRYMPVPSSKEVLRYVYQKYPKEAKIAYKKISSYKREDLEETLNGFERMNPIRKKYALRMFDIKEKEFNEVHKECTREEESR